MPAIDTVGAAQPEFHLVGLAGPQRLGPTRRGEVEVVLVDELAPPGAEHFDLADAEVVKDATIDAGQLAAHIGRPDVLGNGFVEEPLPFEEPARVPPRAA